MEHRPTPQLAEETLSARSSDLGRDRNVRRSKSAVIGSVRFHGRSESILAIRQYPNMTSAKVPTAGSQKCQRIGRKIQTISSSVYAKRSCTGNAPRARSRAKNKTD